MLDEPAGHFIANNIKWLEEWLEVFPVSIICTSHLSPFLDKMCAHLRLPGPKAVDFQKSEGNYSDSGRLEIFRKDRVFELSNESMKFICPEPGAMEGVKGCGKVVLRMNSVTLTHPPKDRPTIMDVTRTVFQVSRVALIRARRDIISRRSLGYGYVKFPCRF